MMYTIKFDEKIIYIIKEWKKSNPHLHKKLVKLLTAIVMDPRHGIGHPEPLVGGSNEVYSRRISAHDRIIYHINDDEIYVLIVEIGGHYNDK